MSASFVDFFRIDRAMLKQIVAVWMQPVHQRLNIEGKKMLWLLIGLFPVLGVGVAIFLAFRSDAPNVSALLLIASAGFGVDFFVGAVMWFVMLVINVGQIYSPANASLAPNLKRILQWALAIPILILPPVIAVIIGLIKHVDTTPFWFGSVVFMLAFVSIIRNRWMFVAPIILSQLPRMLSEYHIAIPGASLQAASSGWLVPLGLFLIFVVLHWVFVGGDHLFERREQLAKMQQGKLENGGISTFPKIQRLYASPFLALMDHKLNQRSIGKSLLPFALGPQAHWTNIVLQVLGMTALMTVWFTFMLPHDDASKRVYSSAIIYLMILPGAFAAMIQIAIYRNRVGQALAGLAPAAPNNIAQMRILLTYGLRQYLLLWAVILIAAILGAGFITSDPFFRHLIYLCCFSLLPLSLSVVRNYAQMQSTSDFRIAAIAFGALVILGASAAILYWLPFIPYWSLCGVIFLMTTFALRWRWKKLMLVNAMFPAGRGV